jgi:hypothetical protein
MFWGFLDGSLSEAGLAGEDIPEDSEAGLNYVSMTDADLNCDGNQDLLVTDQHSNLLIMLGNGRGTFQGLRSIHPRLPLPQFTPARNRRTTTIGDR